MPYNRDRFDPKPSFVAEEMTGAQMSEPLAWLVGRMIDGLIVDGRELISVDHRFESHDGMVHVMCTDTEGASHMFEYDPTDRSDPVRHVVLGDVQTD